MGSAMIGGILNASGNHRAGNRGASEETLDAIHSRFSIGRHSPMRRSPSAAIFCFSPSSRTNLMVIPRIAPHVKTPASSSPSLQAGPLRHEEAFGKEIKLVNRHKRTPALVGEAMSAHCVSMHMSPKPRLSESAGDLQLLWKSRSRTGEPH